ncbi:cell wall surface anchor family protein [Burkholderia pseudomallei]|nr:cell wall surface anchor family protein [Burkholderia pseudomallei]CAJ4640505.1 cell wall surface anchor family protein [Burkholderia pseudomallei]CAJ7299125.1 cell wall surface anchor family protein [Burkholderia pseudomallei]
MKEEQSNMKIARLAFAASMCAALVACGGGGGGNAPATDNTPTTTTGGTAAIGSPIIGGTVELKCASSATASATTGTDGSWSASLKSTDYPCVARVSGGQANGTAFASALHSIAAAPGTTNITPLTDIMVGVLGKQDPAAWFDSAKSNDLTSTITAANLNSSLATLATALATLPGKPALPGGFNPLNSPFKAEKGDAGDGLLEIYGAALAASGLSQSDAATKAANSAALTRTAYSAIAYTTPGITAIQMGSSVNLDGTFAIAIADPNRGKFTAKATIDAGGNVTSFTDAGQFKAVISLLGNRVGELCTANGVGSVVAAQPGQYVYVSSDLTEVTNPTELNGKTFDEYEDCVKSGTMAFANGSSTFTDTNGKQDAPNTNVAQALTGSGLADTANHSVEHAKIYKYAANGVTKYAYITVNSTTGTDGPLTFDTDAKYVTIGLSQ